MFTDTHFHLIYLPDLGIDCDSLFEELAKSDFRFLMDIGIECDDLKKRFDLVSHLSGSADFIQKNLFFTAGIWPSLDAIDERKTQMDILKKNVLDFTSADFVKQNGNRLVAIGECGLDHHRVEELSPVNLRGKNEEELFEMQLEFARSVNLPVVIHSRDAFDETLSCMKNVGYHNGEIHCFSYGIKEAKSFLDLGWYIALGGAITYTKKSKMDEMEKLIRYIPRDRLLLETDAPYLAPIPYRGETNTPALIVHTYQFIADILQISVEELGIISYENAKRLFL